MSAPTHPTHPFKHAHPSPPVLFIDRIKTQCATGSVNQIPPHATISGDCRVTPFYSVAAVMKSIEGYVAEINANPTILPSRGPFSKYVLPAEDRKGSLELSWMGKGEDGIACNLESEGALALNSATATVRSNRALLFRLLLPNPCSVFFVLVVAVVLAIEKRLDICFLLSGFSWPKISSI